MTEYQIQPNTRRCTATGRELLPGEKFYSVLLDEIGGFVRQDFAGEAWSGPPEKAFSFWAGRVPPPERANKPRIDDELLMDCFQRLEGQSDANRVNFRFVVALLLTRRRRLRLEGSKQENGLETLKLRDTRTGTQHQVVNPNLADEEITAVQEEVFKVLGWE